MPEPPDNYIRLTPGALRSALFGWEEHWGERCLSVTTTEPDSFYPRRVPLEVARILEKHDPGEVLFKIFFYPTHAEVWHKDQWLLSASYRFFVTCAAAIRRQKHEATIAAEREQFDRLQYTKTKVLELFPGLQYTSPRAFIEFCRAIWITPRDSEFFTKFPALLSILDYEPPRRSPDGAENSPVPSTPDSGASQVPLPAPAPVTQLASPV